MCYIVWAGKNTPREVVMVYFMSGFDGDRKKARENMGTRRDAPHPPSRLQPKYQPSPLDFQASTSI
jgi:hypothetical protein